MHSRMMLIATAPMAIKSPFTIVILQKTDKVTTKNAHMQVNEHFFLKKDRLMSDVAIFSKKVLVYLHMGCISRM